MSHMQIPVIVQNDNNRTNVFGFYGYDLTVCSGLCQEQVLIKTAGLHLIGSS